MPPGALIRAVLRHPIQFFKIRRQVKRIRKEGVTVENVTKILAAVFKMKFIPSGYLTVGAGVVGILAGLLCMAGVEIPGIPCPEDPMTLLTAGAGLIGLGRRG